MLNSQVVVCCSKCSFLILFSFDSPRERKFGANVRTVGQEPSNTSGNGSGGNVNSGWGRGNSVSGGGGGATATTGGLPPQNPLDKVAVMLGIHGKTANAPAVMGIPETPIPLIYILLVILLGVVFRNYLIPVFALVGFYGLQYSKLQQQRR